MKKIVSVLSILLLSACATGVSVTTDPIKRQTLDIVSQKPLNLAPVEFKVKVENNTPDYCLSSENYANLSNNMEKVQNHLDIQKQTVDVQKSYYERLNK